MAGAVLLVDDNAVQAAVRQTILKRDGFDVHVALSPTRALERFEAADFPVDIGLVLTDHLMPGMNGAQFVRELRRLNPHVPVLVISGLEEAELEYAGLRVVFRTKPLLPETLLTLVRSLLASGQVPDRALDQTPDETPDQARADAPAA